MIEITQEYLAAGQTEYGKRCADFEDLLADKTTWNHLVASWVNRADNSGYGDIELDGAVVTYLASIQMKYNLPYVFDLRRLTFGTKKPKGQPNTVGEWIAALKKLKPDLPLFVRPKYTGESSWVNSYPIYTTGLNEMEAGDDVSYPHATILY